MAPLFLKVDSNKLWRDVQHEENVISAKFGKDLFNISKVVDRKKVAQFFLTHSVYSYRYLFTFAAAETAPETVWVVRETKLEHVSVWT